MRFQRLSGATALFHGETLGHYTLPDQLLGAYRAATRLLHPAPGDLPTVTRGAAHDQLVAEYLDAAGAGRPFPVADAVLAERAAAEEADARPTGGFDAGARESAPGPGPSMNQLMRRAIGRRRYGDPGRFDADYFPPDDPPAA